MRLRALGLSLLLHLLLLALLLYLPGPKPPTPVYTVVLEPAPPSSKPPSPFSTPPSSRGEEGRPGAAPGGATASAPSSAAKKAPSPSEGTAPEALPQEKPSPSGQRVPLSSPPFRPLGEASPAPEALGGRGGAEASPEPLAARGEPGQEAGLEPPGELSPLLPPRRGVQEGLSPRGPSALAQGAAEESLPSPPKAASEPTNLPAGGALEGTGPEVLAAPSSSQGEQASLPAPPLPVGRWGNEGPPPMPPLPQGGEASRGRGPGLGREDLAPPSRAGSGQEEGKCALVVDLHGLPYAQGPSPAILDPAGNQVWPEPHRVRGVASELVDRSGIALFFRPGEFSGEGYERIWRVRALETRSRGEANPFRELVVVSRADAELLKEVPSSCQMVFLR